MVDIGREQTFQADGRTWTLSRLTVARIFEFRDWIAEQEGDYWEVADKFVQRLKDDQSKLAILKECKAIRDQLRGFSMGCDLCRRYLSTEAGMAAMWKILLREHHPNVTDAQAFDLLAAYGETKASENNETGRKLRLAIRAAVDMVRDGDDADAVVEQAALAFESSATDVMTAFHAALDKANGRLPNGSAPSAA